MVDPVVTVGHARLGELLIQRGIITAPQLEEALERQRRSGQFLGAVLVEKGWASEEEVARALSEQLGMAYVDLASHPADPETRALIPDELCRTHLAVPLFTVGESLTVAMANPLDTAAIDAFQRAGRRHIRPVFATASAIRQVLEETAGDPAGAGALIGLPLVESERGAGPAERRGAGEPQVAKLKASASLAPVIQLVDTLITDAMNAGASDIHLEPAPETYHCRFRIDGILHDRPELPKVYEAAIVSRIKIMANMDIAEKRLPQDGRIQTTAAGRELDLRVSTFPTVHGENVVIRLLDKRRALLTLDDLGFSKGILAQFTMLITKPHGIILVTGPTGSGKTTTLYAVLNKLNRPDVNIMTLEDPVEYELPRIRQSQVNVKAGLTFATGLRSMVRQDPDIVLIGEIRDKETADIAIHASLTGHLVFSTLHTNDAASAATRLVDMGVEPFLVATSLVGVLAQRLVRTLCPGCKTPYDPPPALVERLGIPPGKATKFFKEVACARCRQTGYRGRVGLYELLVPNERIRQLITQRTPAGAITEEALRLGMVTLRQDGMDKLLRGMTSLAEVLRVTGEE